MQRRIAIRHDSEDERGAGPEPQMTPYNDKEIEAVCLGMAGQTSHCTLLTMAEKIVRVARKHGKKWSLPAAADFYSLNRLCVDLLFCPNDIVDLKVDAQLDIAIAIEAVAAAAIGGSLES
jgi:hypothetical protein